MIAQFFVGLHATFEAVSYTHLVAMQRPVNYLTEIETYLEKTLAEALEEEKTA